MKPIFAPKHLRKGWCIKHWHWVWLKLLAIPKKNDSTQFVWKVSQSPKLNGKQPGTIYIYLKKSNSNLMLCHKGNTSKFTHTLSIKFDSPKMAGMPAKSTELGESTVNLASFTKLIFFCVRLAMLMKLSDQNLKSRIQQWICLFPKIKGVKFEEMYMKPLPLARINSQGDCRLKSPHSTRSTIHPLSNHCSPLC